MTPLFQTMIWLREGRPFIPKGVWRFASHEEADEWKMKMLTRAIARVRVRDQEHDPSDT